MTKKRIYLAYYFCLLVLAVLGYVIPVVLTKTVWIAVIIEIIVLIVLFFVAYYADDILDSILPKAVKDSAGIYFLRFNSREFEEFVGEEILGLILDTRRLMGQENGPDVSDYSYRLLPLAKAYEGVLKKILVHLNFVTEEELREKPSITVNSYFNPQGNLKIFDVLKDKARHKTIPYTVFATYQECRNEILHYDPYANNQLPLRRASYYQDRLEEAIIRAFDTFVKS